MFNLAPVPVPDLTGKTVLVTGAGRGIGAETVRLLVKNGARVFAGLFDDHADTNEPLPETATRLPLDVTSQDQVDAAIERVNQEAGRLDVLINNAGTIAPIGRLSRLNSDDLIPALAVNVAGVHRVTVAALPLLREAHEAIPDNAEIAFHYAVGLHRDGQDAAAKSLLQSLLANGQSFPGSAEAKDLLNRISQ